LEFKNKEFDGVYEVYEVQINNEGQIFRGLLYFPAEKFKKPYPLIIYFHGFPQLFCLTEIVKNYDYLLDFGYSFILFNFRGYRYSEGQISLQSQVSDALKIIEFVEIMARNNIFDIKEINILGYDLGAYIALILCSKIKIINRLMLISPILDLKKHVYNKNFYKSLIYINRFLPGNVKGIENINEFIEYTKEELNNDELQIEKLINQLDIRKLKIFIGENDRLTPIKEVNRIFKRLKKNIRYELSIMDQIDHECTSEEELEKMNDEITKYFY
jgi:pimeloyl-ACP methyl ester carboxylesterase